MMYPIIIFYDQDCKLCTDDIMKYDTNESPSEFAWRQEFCHNAYYGFKRTELK